MHQDFDAWKNEELRDEVGMAGHPAGQIDLSGVGGLQQEELSTWPCFFGVTIALSCAPACERTVWHGTCNVNTVGCCEAAS
jgi:hypothetical protein